MSLPLTEKEKEQVADILYILYSATVIEVNKKNINRETIDALEKALSSIEKCNHDMKILLAQLIGGSSLISKGWFRKTLSKIHREVTNNKIKLNGLACRVTGAIYHKSAILMTIQYGH